MVENLIYGLAFMGGLSLYVVIASTIGKAIYKGINGTEGERFGIALMGGLFFPVTLPIIVVALWLMAMVNIPCSKEKECSHNGHDKDDDDEEDEEDEEDKKPTTLFNVGDLVTGVKGNPGNYKKLYEGCVCRVLNVSEEDEELKMILVDHIDKDAHKRHIGGIHCAPWKNFTLIKPKKVAKRTIKKKVTRKRKK